MFYCESMLREGNYGRKSKPNALDDDTGLVLADNGHRKAIGRREYIIFNFSASLCPWVILFKVKIFNLTSSSVNMKDNLYERAGD